MSKTMNKLPVNESKMYTIKNKMLAYTLLIIILMSVLSVYSLMITNVYKSRIDHMFERNIKLNAISDKLDTVHQELYVFLSTKSSTSLNNYYMHTEELSDMIDDTTMDVEFYTEEELMVLDIKNMLKNYGLEADYAVEEKRRNNDVALLSRYEDANQIKSYIEVLINELNIRQLDTNAKTYTYMTKQIASSSRLNVFLIVDLVLLSIIIVLQMTNHMINPLVKLSHSAEAISKGNFETEEIVVKTNDEIEILANAFNKMKLSIHAYIEELKEKAYTEAKLKDQEMENLKIQSLLDNAKLYALQSQMNPHFLFNTINAGVQLSMIEGADRTSEFLESMSRLFRYNIKKLDHPVTIAEEIDNVKDYYELLKVRFGELITFTFHVDSSSNEFLIPPLTLQPIVENAYIHGLSGIEEGGRIRVQVLNNTSKTLITIEDNGAGMSRAMQKKILRKTKVNLGDKPNSSGIGMRNLIQRLELFYNKKDLLSIRSEKNSGTKIIIEIPNIIQHERFMIE